MAETTVRIVMLGDSSSAVRSISTLESATSSLRRTMKLATVALVAGFAGGLGAAISKAGDFEHTLNVFEATAGATGKQMKLVSGLAKALGADVRLPATSAADAAEAMTQLAKGGLSVADSMKAARGVLQLSAAAQIDNAQAANIVADALNAFQLKGHEASRVSDLLAASANVSTGEVTDMAQALQQSSASASGLGIPIEDLVTAITQMANAGVKGSDAGTSLKTAFQFLIPKSKDAAAELKKLGVTAFDQHGEFVGLRELIGQYSDAVRDLTPEQRAAGPGAARRPTGPSSSLATRRIPPRSCPRPCQSQRRLVRASCAPVHTWRTRSVAVRSGRSRPGGDARRGGRRSASRCRFSLDTERRGWDSNPGGACTPNGFQDRPIRPLWHPAGTALSQRRPAVGPGIWKARADNPQGGGDAVG